MRGQLSRNNAASKSKKARFKNKYFQKNCAIYGLDPVQNLDPEPELELNLSKVVTGTGTAINYYGSITLML